MGPELDPGSEGGPLEAVERALWEAAGARFPDDGGVDVHAALAATLGRIVDRAAVGDAAAAAALRASTSEVRRRRDTKGLLAFDVACYPRSQFAGGRPLRGLRAVLRAMPAGIHPLTIDHWMTAPNDALAINDEDLSPVDWLRRYDANGTIETSRRLRVESEFDETQLGPARHLLGSRVPRHGRAALRDDQ